MGGVARLVVWRDWWWCGSWCGAVELARPGSGFWVRGAVGTMRLRATQVPITGTWCAACDMRFLWVFLSVRGSYICKIVQNKSMARSLGDELYMRRF